MGWKYKAGLLLILAVELLWITSAEIIQGVLTTYEHPFAITYLEISLLAAYLPAAFVTAWLTKSAKLCFGWNDNSEETTESHEAKDQPASPYYNLVNVDSDIEQQQRLSEKLSNKQVAKLALAIGPLWFISQYLAKAAVARTSVTSATLLLSTSSLFTLWIGTFLGQESLNGLNIVSVIVSMAGVAMTALSKNGVHSFVGDILALLSAMTDSLFTVLLKRYAGEGERVDMQMLFGYIGLSALASLWWLVWPLTALGMEPKFKFPQTAELKVIIANSFVGTVFCDYFWGVGVTWTTPLVAAIGSSLTIPIAMMEDMLIHGHHYSAFYLLGSLMVIAGFGIANVCKWLSIEMSSNCLNYSLSLLV